MSINTKKSLQIRQLAVEHLMLKLSTELRQRSKRHDVSSFTSDELPFLELYLDNYKNSEKGTDEHKELCMKLQPALVHHYAKNDHHPEHFDNGILSMNLVQITEMLCDWIVSAKEDNVSKTTFITMIITDYTEKYKLSNELQSILVNTVDTLWD